MKIVSLIAENVKRLVAVEIKPDGDLVEITGRNGQGKSSILDAIWWALTGAEHIQAQPIRKGADTALIRLDMGEIVVTRKFSRKGPDGFTTSIVVENQDGARFPSPQRMLDGLLGALSFDPLAFARMKPREQFDALRRFVPDIDFEQVAVDNKDDFDRRTEYNRAAKQERAAAAAIVVPQDTPDELVDEADLVEQLGNAGTINSDIEVSRERRAQAREKITRLRNLVAGSDEALNHFAESQATARDTSIERLREQIKRLEEQVEAEAVECQAHIDAEVIRGKVVTEAANREADELETNLKNAVKLREPVDVAALQVKIQEARATNAHVTRARQRKQHERTADQAEAAAKVLTEQIQARNADKEEAIAAAEMPVAGIGFGDGAVLLNGLPFEQGSDAEQLRASVKIAAAMNPKLRVIRIRDGSLLDDQAMTELAAFAAEQDLQIWCERVDSSGQVGFVIEDGHARKARKAQVA